MKENLSRQIEFYLKNIGMSSDLALIMTIQMINFIFRTHTRNFIFNYLKYRENNISDN